MIQKKERNSEEVERRRVGVRGRGVDKYSNSVELGRNPVKKKEISSKRKRKAWRRGGGGCRSPNPSSRSRVVVVVHTNQERQRQRGKNRTIEGNLPCMVLKWIAWGGQLRNSDVRGGGRLGVIYPEGIVRS